RTREGVEIDAVTVPDAPAVTVDVIVAMRVSVRVALVGVFVLMVRLRVVSVRVAAVGCERHLNPEHPQADRDDEQARADAEVGLHALRRQPQHGCVSSLDTPSRRRYP